MDRSRYKGLLQKNMAEKTNYYMLTKYKHLNTSLLGIKHQEDFKTPITIIRYDCAVLPYPVCLGTLGTYRPACMPRGVD